MPDPTPRTDGYASGDRSRQEILDAALRLFASRGIDAVSMRAISNEAGQANVSAAQYYFGNKMNIIQALLEDIHQHIATQRKVALNSAERLAPDVPDYTKKILTAAFEPHISLLAQGDWGNNAIRLLARVVWEAGVEGRRALIEPFGEDMLRVESMLHKGLPHIPRQRLQLRFMFSLGNLLHGLADLPILEDSPFGPLLAADYNNAPTVLEEFIAYMAAGIEHA